MAATWERSRETLADLRRRLDAIVDVPGLETVAIAGSLARFEQTASSDTDLIIVVSDGANADEIGRAVWGVLPQEAFRLPKSAGIFTRPIAWKTLRNPATLGVIDEDIAEFGLRMQLLLEGRPVCRDDRFPALLQQVLQRFLLDADQDEHPWRSLLDDLLRYHRSQCVRYRAARNNEPHRWRERQLKAGYGRLVNVVGLLTLLGDSLAETNPFEAGVRGCDRTPLQRIAASYRRHGDAGFDRVAALYDPFLAAFNHATFRDRLNVSLEPDAEAAATWNRLIANARELKRELTRFLQERIHRRDWPPQFCDDLLL